MPRGLGIAQRRMLFTLARHEVEVAELAAQMQHPYRSPDRWNLHSLTVQTFLDEIEAPQRAAHDYWRELLRTFNAPEDATNKAAKQWAREEIAFHIEPLLPL